MNEEKIYQFKQKSFKKAFKIADSIYSLSIVLDDYCKYHSNDEDIKYLIPLTDIIRRKADEINFFFCSVDMNTLADGIDEFEEF